MKSWNKIDGWTRGIEQFYPQMVANAVAGAVFVEIGSWRGRSTALMAQTIKASGKDIKFFTVDHGRGTSNYPLQLKQVAEVGGDMIPVLLENLKKCGVRDLVDVIAVDTRIAATMFSNETIDFLFLDGDHDSEAVKLELAAWWPKVKRGGVAGGHDLGGEFSVYAPVMQFFKPMKLPVKLVHECCWLVNNPLNDKGLIRET